MGILAVLAMSVTLAVPGRSNANVSLAAEGTFVVATWAATAANGPTDIYAAISRDSGSTFAAPVRVNAREGEARTNGEQPPHVALVPRRGQAPAIVIVWTAKRETGTVLLAARSNDAGRSFGASDAVPGSEAAGNRGWDAITVDNRGVVQVVWLDHRELAPPQGTAAAAGAAGASKSGGSASSGSGGSGNGASSGGAAHQHHADGMHDGVAMAQKSKLYVAAVGQPAASARAITAGVCYCCKTALTAGPAGSLFAAWRHVYPGNERDIAFTVSRDNGRTFAEPIRVSSDQWMLNGCPDDGPSMAADARGRIHIAWPTLVADDANGDPTIGLFYASSADGKSFSKRERIPTEGQAHHPQLALTSDGSVAVVWDELSDSGRRIVLARATGGAFQREVLSTSAATYPVLAVSEQGLLAAWTSGGAGSESSIHIERIESKPIGSR